MRNLFTSLVWTFCVALWASSAGAQTPAAKKPVVVPPKATAVSNAVPIVLTEQQLAIAQIVHTGRINCAEGAHVTIMPDAKVTGAFDLQFGKAKYDVLPMATKSGAIRLEDLKSGIVYMQLANKSMLFNEKQGKRLADDCINPAQQAVADAMKLAPPVSVLDEPTKK